MSESVHMGKPCGECGGCEYECADCGESAARIAQLEAALRPFAEWGPPPDTYTDEKKLELWGSPKEDTYSFVTMGDLRRARSVLGAHP